MYVGSMAWTWRTRTCRALLRQVRYTVLTKGIPRRGKERALCWKGFGRLSFVLEKKYRMDVVETSSETVEVRSRLRVVSVEKDYGWRGRRGRDL